MPTLGIVQTVGLERKSSLLLHDSSRPLFYGLPPKPPHSWVRGQGQRLFLISLYSQTSIEAYDAIWLIKRLIPSASPVLITVLSLPGKRCSLANGGCEGLCSDTRWGVRCSCAAGWQLQPDGQSCGGPISLDSSILIKSVLHKTHIT